MRGRPRVVGREAVSGLKVFALILGIYLLFMAGHTYSPDEETLIATSVSLIERGTFALERNSTQVQVPGQDGRIYSQYGPGQPVAALPFAAAGILLGDAILDLDANGEAFVLRMIAGMFNPAVTAALCALFWSALRLLGCGRRYALLLALILAFATYLWPHSRTFFGEPLTALLLFLSFYLLLRSRAALVAAGSSPPRAGGFAGYGLLAGFAMGAVVAVKVQYIVALPALGLYALWLVYELWFRRGESGARRAGLALLAGMAAGGTLALLLLMLYNWSAFGSPFSTGYGSDLAATFKTPLYEGLFGLLFSSGKGIWIYAPPIFLAILGWSAFFRRHRAEAAATLILALPVLVLFALYRFWPGDGAWGPRYLVPILPFVVLPAAGLAFAAHRPEAASRAWLRPPRPALLVFGAIGLAVNFGGAAMNFDTYINVVNHDATRYWYPEASPVRGHWVLLQQRADEWRCRVFSCAGALLRDGFSYSEGDKFLGDLFPRWTHGRATISLPPEPVTVVMRVADHRPPPLPRAEVSLTAQRGAVTSQERVPVPDAPVSSILTATVQPAAGGVAPTLVMDIPPWNPHEVAGSPRDEELGLMVEQMAVYDAGGRRLPLREALPIAPMYPAPRWYYDPGSHHPLDWWPWYLYAAGLPRRAGVTALAIMIPALLALAWALPAVIRSARRRRALSAEC